MRNLVALCLSLCVMSGAWLSADDQLSEVQRLRGEVYALKTENLGLRNEVEALKAQNTVLTTWINQRMSTERTTLEQEFLAAVKAPTGWTWDWPSMSAKAPVKKDEKKDGDPKPGGSQ